MNWCFMLIGLLLIRWIIEQSALPDRQKLFDWFFRHSYHSSTFIMIEAQRRGDWKRDWLTEQFQLLHVLLVPLTQFTGRQFSLYFVLGARDWLGSV